jgi:fibrillarin-like pre-rRNA processing protein
VFDDVVSTLEEAYEVLDTARLDRFHEDHLGVVATPR